MQTKETKIGSALMGSTHTYDIKKGDLQVSIENPEDLEDLDAEALKDRWIFCVDCACVCVCVCFVFV